MSVPVSESGESPYKALAAAFMKANPDYSVSVEETATDTYGQALNTKLQAGNAADIFEVAPGRGQQFSVLPLAENGYVLDLAGTNAANTVPAGSEDQFQIDGKTYAQGLDFSISGSVTNMALMKADGIETYPETYKELLADCGIAKTKGHSFFTIAGSVPPNAGFFSMVVAGDLVYGPNPTWNADRQADKVTFADDKGWNATLDRLSDLKDAGCFQDSPEAGTFDTITNNLVGGQSYAATIPSAALLGLAGAAPTAEFVLQPFPSDSGTDTVVSASVNYALAINAKSPAVDAAKKFLDFASEGDGATVFSGVTGNLPVVGGNFDSLPPQFAGVAQLLADGKTYALPNAGWESAEVYNALGTGVQGIFTGQASVPDVLKAMDSAW